jgi:hypothetical protein
MPRAEELAQRGFVIISERDAGSGTEESPEG